MPSWIVLRACSVSSLSCFSASLSFLSTVSAVWSMVVLAGMGCLQDWDGRRSRSRNAAANRTVPLVCGQARNHVYGCMTLSLSVRKVFSDTDDCLPPARKTRWSLNGLRDRPMDSKKERQTAMPETPAFRVAPPVAEPNAGRLERILGLAARICD